MSFVRIKQSSVFKVASYRKDGKVKQTQKYLGKAKSIKVEKNKLMQIFDWVWHLKITYFTLNDDKELVRWRQNSLLNELQWKKAKEKTDTLFSHLASLLRDQEENELEIQTIDLWRGIILAEDIARNTGRIIGDEAKAISEAFQKLVGKQYEEILF